MRNWKASKLGEVSTFIRGITFKPGDVVPVGSTDSIVCMRTKNVQSDLDLSDVWAVHEGFVKRKDQLLQYGDILVSSANSWNLIGKCCWVPSLPWRTTFGGFVSILRADVVKVDARFLFHWFRSEKIQRIVRGFGQQTTNISNLNIDRCRDLVLPLPPLPEQRRIAEVLDKAEELRAKRQASLDKATDIAEAIFTELFVDNDSSNWSVTDIAGIAQQIKGAIRTGPFGSQLLHSEFVEEGVAVLGIDNVVVNEFRWSERRYITESKYRQLKRYTVHPGDVLISIMGTCGRCAVVPVDIPLAINTKHLCCITLDQQKCLPVFLQAYFLQHPVAQQYLSRTAKGAIMAGLNMEIIKGMPISLPPLALQQKFARRIAAVEKVKAACRASLTELAALFASLQHRAFRGEL